jgi:molybdate transport repressor ModE-like protein
MLYDTALLRTFVAVCDTGSFTKAAREVNLTQSAVSLHVKRLEDQVGAQLILRNARGLSLTGQGEVLLSYARRILALYKEAEQRLGRDSGGLVRIGAPDYFDFHILSSLLAQFSARYPAVRQQVELGIGPDISAMLDEGELDIAIVASEIGESDGRPLCRERRVWAAGRAMHLDPKEPAPLALYPPHCRWRKLALDELDRAGRTWTVVLQSAGTAGILAALDAGLGISIFPEHGLPSTLKPLGSAEALPKLPDFEFVLRRSRNCQPVADHLAEMIVNSFQLSTALRPAGMNYEEGSALNLRSGFDA